MRQDGQLLNYIGGEWRRSRAGEYLDVRNPATAETIVRVPLTQPEEIDEASQLAQTAFADWRRTPPTERIQYLLELEEILNALGRRRASPVGEGCLSRLNCFVHLF